MSPSPFLLAEPANSLLARYYVPASDCIVRGSKSEATGDGTVAGSLTGSIRPHWIIARLVLGARFAGNRAALLLEWAVTAFVAIDFETADQGRDSACSVALVRVVNNQITWSAERLIRPPRRNFVFSYVHGIRWADVADCPEFGAVWDDLAPMLEDTEFLAAHNASFDRSVLGACAKAHRRPLPELPFVCTMHLARRAWQIYPTKLPDVCRRLRIPLRHHNAASDAEACARIVMRAVDDGFSAFSSQPRGAVAQ